ncbi:MAG: SpoIIE family protein phosphatase [Ignavibacteriaceae bacterium]|nr:SpoIIE family protein phosphatase [Ignavibacterium sp.]MCC6255224.1 SpoIIE family protein phosphatase [Ignavibacteriaceae bacterium]HRN26134.1 SpoIIE family protein phosphatase [Ignavibacteriaceae bacterium]HRP93806.1 SpoIIE family protein phosphatase [Ignavibacteriaceae bacterium]HRQ53771.1 SpoIIE family protein phosphatase [Ignavibacteriaceae bacterium]
MTSAKILVVDDEPDLEFLIIQKFRAKIKSGEYEFLFAKDGAEALEIIKSREAINLVLTDINMPVMDGLTLLSKINELNNKLLRSIIVSAYGDMENIRTAMNRGAYDFITKPIDLKDLEITIEKSLKEIAEYKIILSAHDKLIAFKKELDIANAIQSSILPVKFPAFPDRNEFDIYAKMIPAKEVGGDLYDFFLIDESRLGVVIADVSGKGIAAALLMAVTKTLLKATALKGLPVDDVLSEINKILAEDSPSNMFVTVFYGVLDTSSGAFEYCNGGHNSPFLISTDGKVNQLEKVGGLLIGAIKDADYESSVVMLKPDETLFFYTDGVTEAFNKNEEEYEEARLIEVLKNNNTNSAIESVKSVFDNVQKFADGVEQSDDITCLALKYLKH